MGGAVSVLVSFPLLSALVCSVLYWCLAMKLPEWKDASRIAILVMGLGLTLFAIGIVHGVSARSLGCFWFIGLLLILVTRRFPNSLGHCIEKFGIVHGGILYAAMFLGGNL